MRRAKDGVRESFSSSVRNLRSYIKVRRPTRLRGVAETREDNTTEQSPNNSRPVSCNVGC